MADADASLKELYFAEESNWGDDPSQQSYDLSEIRYTDEDLSQNTEMQASEEVRGDRQVADQTRVFYDAGGPINFELSYATFDTLFEHALLDSFSSALNISGTDISVTASTSKIESTSTDFSSVTEGQWIKTSGFSTASNNDYWYVTNVATNALTVRDNAGNLTDEAAGQSVSIDGSTLRNGTTKKSMFIEKYFSDVTEYNYYTGMRVNSMDLNFNFGERVTGSFGFMGEKEVTNKQSSQGDSTSQANINPIFNCSEHVPRFVEGGSVLAPARVFSLSLQNQVRNRQVLGQATTRESGVGTIQLSGTLEAYFPDPTLYEKYINFTETSFSILTEDPDGNAYIITVFAANFSDGSASGSGVDSDVITPLNWSAQVEAGDIAKTIQIDKFAA